MLVGDFLQLRPVANFFDRGRFLFESPLVKAIPHRLELTTILRRNADNRDFIACLKEIRNRRCGEKSLEFISSLSRDLSEELMEGAVHIFFKRLPVQIFNLNILFSLPGVLVMFEASNEGDVRGIQCPADRVLLLKTGCKVMLLWNKSNSLWNGSQGRFVGTRGNNVVVDFDGEGQVVVKREAWTKTSRTGDAVGSTQIPLCLMWGITMVLSFPMMKNRGMIVLKSMPPQTTL